MQRHILELTVAVTAAIGLAGCSSSSTAPTPTPTDTKTLAGRWAGVVGTSADDGRSVGVTWSAERIGQGLSGPATLSARSSSRPVTFAGTLTGTRSGEELLLRFTSDPGRGTGCAASAVGSAHTEGFTISGDLAIEYTSCDSLGLQPPASMALQLLKALD